MNETVPAVSHDAASWAVVVVVDVLVVTGFGAAAHVEDEAVPTDGVPAQRCARAVVMVVGAVVALLAGLGGTVPAVFQHAGGVTTIAVHHVAVVALLARCHVELAVAACCNGAIDVAAGGFHTAAIAVFAWVGVAVAAHGPAALPT